MQCSIYRQRKITITFIILNRKKYVFLDKDSNYTASVFRMAEESKKMRVDSELQFYTSPNFYKIITGGEFQCRKNLIS